MRDTRSFKERVEEKPLFWLMWAIISGFAAGIATYESALRIQRLEVVTRAEYLSLAAAKSTSPTPAHWAGKWRTDTESYKGLSVEFTQRGSELVGSYRIPGQASQVAQGVIRGSIQGDYFVGTWTERQSDSDLSGDLYLVLYGSGNSFVGYYSRRWEPGSKRYVWSGTRLE